jgi:hypothetical protein
VEEIYHDLSTGEALMNAAPSPSGALPRRPSRLKNQDSERKGHYARFSRVQNTGVKKKIYTQTGKQHG